VKSLFLASFVLLASCSLFKRDQIVIEVGDVKFSKEYFSKRFVEKLKNLDGLHVKDVSVTQSFSSALTQELIVEGYLYTWAAKNKVSFSRADVVAYLREYLASSDGFENDFLFEARPSKNLLEDSVKVQLIKNRLMKTLEDRLLVGEDEISAYYKANPGIYNEKKIHLAQIFLEKEADADMILKFLKSGTPFEDLAKKYSLSPEGKNGGDMGWVGTEGNAHMVPLMSAPVGVVMKPFKSPQGYHLYKIIGFKKTTNQPLAEVKDHVIHDIKEKKLADAYLLWLEEQVKTVRVETNEGIIQSLNPSYQETL